MQKYSCKVCDAELYWDSKSGSLKCEYCGSEFHPSDYENTETTQQRVEEANVNEKATDESEEGVKYLKYLCTECGAEIITAEGTIATTCVYCGHAISISSKLNGTFKPDMVIPFAITKEEAKTIYEKYCKKSFLTPKAFKDKNVLENKMKGIYAPFTFHSFKDNADAIVDCEKTISYRSGNDKVVIHQRYRIDIDATGTFDKIPTDALQNLDNDLMDAIEPFNYDHLQPFSPAYMAGFYAEEKNESSEVNYKRAIDRSKDAMKDKILNTVQGYSSKSMSSCNNHVTDYTSQYVMLPVWLFVTEYKDKKYTFAINGDTGKITGKLPIDPLKILMLLGISIGGSQILGMLIRLLEFI